MDKLYALAELKVNADATGSDTYALGLGNFDIKLSSSDVNGLLLYLLQNANSLYTDTESLNLPVSSISFDAEGSINGSITADQYTEITKLEQLTTDSDWNSYLPVTIASTGTTEMNICTASGLGGNIAFAASASLTTTNVENMYKLYEQRNNEEITEDEYNASIKEILTDNISYTVTVTDDDGTQKWTATYTTDELQSIMEAVEADIEEGI